jgi:hypothetical protein
MNAFFRVLGAHVTRHPSRFLSFSDLSRRDGQIKGLGYHAALVESLGNRLVREILLIPPHRGTS